jgi:hypothetical protein
LIPKASYDLGAHPGGAAIKARRAGMALPRDIPDLTNPAADQRLLFACLPN